jgi:proline dehydrogenase
VSLDLLGESVSSCEEAVAARDGILVALDAVSEGDIDGNVSVKLTQLGIDVDGELCADNMTVLLSRAGQLGLFVRIDMESSAYTERTLRLYHERLHPEYGNRTGVVIQSCLRRSANDLEELIKVGARVRLCKGAYAEAPDIAFKKKSDVDTAFVALMERLLADGNYPAIATHDTNMIDQALRIVDKRQLPAESFEFQMLYGVRRDLQDNLRQRGYNVRVYIPFGTNWYPYLMRRLAERPANVLFVVGNIVKEALPGH